MDGQVAASDPLRCNLQRLDGSGQGATHREGQGQRQYGSQHDGEAQQVGDVSPPQRRCPRSECNGSRDDIAVRETSIGEDILPVSQVLDPGRPQLLSSLQLQVGSRIHPPVVQTQVDELVDRPTDELAAAVFEQVRANAARENLHLAALFEVRLGNLSDHTLREGGRGTLGGSGEGLIGECAEDGVRKHEEGEQRPGDPSAERCEQRSPLDGYRHRPAGEPHARQPRQGQEGEARRQ